MIRARMGLLGLLSAAGLLLLLAPGTSEAQVRIGVSVGGGRGGPGFYGGPGYYGGYAPYYRGYGYPGAYGYGYPGAYGYGRSGISIGIGTSPYSYPGYAYPSRYYTPYYTPFIPSGGYIGGPAVYAVPVQQAPNFGREAPVPRVDNTAQIEVRVPPGAKVSFDGAATTQTGAVRRFASPALESGYDYNYTIRATWTENSQPVTRERKVIVQAGGSYVVDLRGEE